MVGTIRKLRFARNERLPHGRRVALSAKTENFVKTQKPKFSPGWHVAMDPDGPAHKLDTLEELTEFLTHEEEGIQEWFPPHPFPVSQAALTFAETVQLGDCWNLLTARASPLEFTLILVAMHSIFILGWKGFSGWSIAAHVVLIWIAMRYVYIRLSYVLRVNVSEVPNYRALQMSTASVARAKGTLERALVVLIRVLSWKEPMLNLVILGGMLVVALILQQVSFTTTLYTAYLAAVIKLNYV